MGFKKYLKWSTNQKEMKFVKVKVLRMSTISLIEAPKEENTEHGKEIIFGKDNDMRIILNLKLNK